jgi:hypothetical protein
VQRWPSSAAAGGGGDAVLARAGLGDHARLAHVLREQALAEHVVDLVRARVGEVLALESDLGAAEVCGHPLREEQRRRAPRIAREQILELGANSGAPTAADRPP